VRRPFGVTRGQASQIVCHREVMAIVAQAILEIGDSHTRFLPPERTVRAEYGWTMRPIGDVSTGP